MKFDISKVKALGAGIVASGKKNAPTLMTAGSIVLGWVGVYIFWRESKKAEQKIEFEESLLNDSEDADMPLEDIQKLPIKDKIIIYAQYCWVAGLCGLASTALAIGANSINLSRLAELTLLAQAMSTKDEKQKELIKKLEEKIPEKQVLKIKQEMYREEADEEAIVDKLKEMIAKGDRRTLFIDRFTGRMFVNDILSVSNGIESFNEHLRKRRSNAIRHELERHKSKLTDPFYAESDVPWWTDELSQEKIEEIEEIYSTCDATEFMYMIGECSKTNKIRLGEVMEFRCFGDQPAVSQTKILNYDKSYSKLFPDPDEVPKVCIIDYTDDLYPTHELLERNIV